MAYSPAIKTGNPLDTDEENKNKINKLGVPDSAETIGQPAEGSAVQAPQAPSNATQGFKDFNKYVDLNAPQTQRLAENINAGIENEAEQARSQRSQFETQALGQIAGGKTQYDAGEAQTELQKPENVSDKFRRLLSGSYAGPTNASQITGFDKLTKEYQDVNDIVGQGETAEGRKQLITNQYGGGNNAFKTGNLSLDQYLLQNTQPAFESLLNKIGSVKPLGQEGLVGAATSVADQAKAAQDWNAQQAALARGDVMNAQGQVVSSANERLQQVRNEVAQQNEAANAAARKLNATLLDPMKAQQGAGQWAQEAKALGITPQQYADLMSLNEEGQDLTAYYKGLDPNSVGLGNVATINDINRYNALAGLIGKDADWLNASQLSALGKGQFDYSTAQGKLAGEKSQRDAARAAASAAAEQAERDRLAAEENERQRLYDLNNPPASMGSSGDGDTSGGMSTASTSDAQEQVNGILGWLEDNPYIADIGKGILNQILGLPPFIMDIALEKMGQWMQEWSNHPVYDYNQRSEHSAEAAQAMEDSINQAIADYGTGGNATGFGNPNANINAENDIANMTVSAKNTAPVTLEELQQKAAEAAARESSRTQADNARGANGGYGYSPESWTMGPNGWDYTDSRGNVYSASEVFGDDSPSQSTPTSNPTDNVGLSDPNAPETGPEAGVGTPAAPTTAPTEAVDPGYTGNVGWSYNDDQGWTYTDNMGNVHDQTSFYNSEDTSWSRDTNHGVGYGGSYSQGSDSYGFDDASWGGTNQSAGVGDNSSDYGGSTDFAATGGYIRQSQGGRIKGDKNYGVDDVPGKTKGGQKLMLDGGEYIIPAGITSMIGADNLDRFMRALGGNPKVRRDE